MLLRRLVLVILSVLVLGLVAAHTQDADTLKLDGKTYRLDGIDAARYLAADFAALLSADAEGNVFRHCGRLRVEH
jgi:hypothetical protein